MTSSPKSVLVIVTRRIGDVLLTTPLIRTIKQAWPDAAVDVLVFAGTESVLAANPDVRHVLTVAERPKWRAHAKLVSKIFRRYDVALSVVPSDRPTIYAWLAGRWRAGLVLNERKHAWKKWLLQRWTSFDPLNTHTVLMHVALADALGVPRCREVVPAWSTGDKAQLERKVPNLGAIGLAVLHTYPKFNYKMWHQSGWLEVARWLRARDLCVVLTGSGDAAEREYVSELAAQMPESINLCGELTLAQTACLLAQARIYVGPDTAPTHMAAAVGIPVVAVYGPSDPVKWGPWPAGQPESNPWRRCGTQTAGNVTLVQGVAACVPCLKEGCDRHIASFSDCLRDLKPATVITAIANALASAPQAEAIHA